MAKLFTSLKHAWNAFRDNDEYRSHSIVDGYGSSYYSRPDRPSLRLSNEKTIITPIFNRLAIDISSIDIKHVRTDKNGRFLEEMDSGLNYCLTTEANLDQAATEFRRDIAMTLFDKGVAAIVPIDTTISPLISGGYDIKTLRVGEIVQWYPKHVRVSLYKEDVGRREEITLPKTMVAIVTNPLYDVMNEPNSTLKRLIQKLNLLDAVDEQAGSGKLNMLIQLPYVVKSEARKNQAEQRRSDIELQLKSSKYGIAYIDGTEKVTQLNRPLENDLFKQVEYLQAMLYSQLGLTEDVMNGTASEQTMLNYHNRTIKPILKAITEALNRTFLTRTARKQRQAVMFFRNPFELAPIDSIAEMADKFTRNEILTSNEIRSIIGIRPSSDPKADKLQNSNMPQPNEGEGVSANLPPQADEEMDEYEYESAY